MDREVSIVLSVEKRNYRKVAQEWYGLTDEQMIGMDVHHNPAVSDGGRNIPEHLFVYHNTLHSAVHNDDFVLWSRYGSAKAHEKRDERGKSVRAMEHFARQNKEKDEAGRSIMAVKGALSAHREKDERGRSKTAVKAARSTNAKKDEFGRSLASLKGAINLHATRWEDPDHPELGHKPPGILVCMQKRRGLPHGPENRRRAG
jgi:hypothetical protein